MLPVLKRSSKLLLAAVYKNHLIAARLSAHILETEGDTVTVGAQLSIGSPFLLWDDPMLGICWDSKKGLDNKFPEKAIELFDSICKDLADQRDENAAADINHAWLYADFLKRKVAFRRDLLAAYESGDKAALRALAAEALPCMIEACEKYYSLNSQDVV